MLATALKRSQSNIKEVQAKMQAQQELHVQQCRQSAVDKSKMLRLTKLQRRVAEHSSRSMQQRVQCLRAGETPMNPPSPLPRWRDSVAQRCDGRARTQRLRPTTCGNLRAKHKTRCRWGCSTGSSRCILLACFAQAHEQLQNAADAAAQVRVQWHCACAMAVT